jgi:hypothetical protein
MADNMSLRSMRDNSICDMLNKMTPPQYQTGSKKKTAMPPETTNLHTYKVMA